MDITLYKREGSPYYWMVWRVNGKRFRESTKCKLKKDAVNVLKAKKDKLMAQEGILDVERLTLENLIDEVVEDYENNDKKTERVRYSKKNILKIFDKTTPLLNIDERKIDEYKKKRKKAKASNGTINRELALLRRGFNLLKEQKRIGKVPKIKLFQENNRRTGFIEKWQYLKLIEKSPEHLKPIVQFTYKCGWRKTEVLNLVWDMVDLDNGIITLPAGYDKNKHGRVYYMDNEVKNLIQRLWNERTVMKLESPYVFLNRQKQDKIKDFRRAWDNSCERAGIKGKLFHDLRRTAARNLVRSGVPERVAMQITGHLTRSTFERYNIVSDTDLKEAALKQQEYLKNQPSEKPEERQQEGIIPNVVFKSNEPDADYMMLSKGETKIYDENGNEVENKKNIELFPPEMVKFKLLTKEETEVLQKRMEKQKVLTETEEDADDNRDSDS